MNPFAEGSVRIGATAVGVIAGAPVRSSVNTARITLANGLMQIPVTFDGNKPLTVKLITGNGVVVKEYRFSSMKQGNRTISVSTGNLPQGVCFAVLSTGECTVAKRVIIVR